jgi:hypothetical protein
MHVTLRAATATALFLGALAAPAVADMSVYYRAGGWDAFSGPGDNGQPVCGVGNTNPIDNRVFSMRFQIGGETVAFQARKPNWTIPNGTQIPVVMQVGLETPWSLQGSGNGQMVEWILDRAAMQAFDAQFRRANSMTLTFPTGNEPPWIIGLSGSTAISNAFGRCVTDMTQRNAAQPQATMPPPNQGPTQPFGEPSPQTAPTSPSQPTLLQPPDTSGGTPPPR